MPTPVLQPGLSDKTKLYNDLKIRGLLTHILGLPSFGPSLRSDGRISYAAVEGVLGDEIDTRRLLEAMADAGILRRVDHTDFLVCPSHMRADLTGKLKCPKCGEGALDKVSLTQHQLCGYVGDMRKFAAGGGEGLKCPQCKRMIADASRELRTSGIWYECKECGANTNSPKVAFICRDGNHEIDVIQLSVDVAYTYELPAETREELRAAFIIAPSIADYLRSRGYEASSPASVTGQSGTSHGFDVYATKAGTSIAVGIMLDSKPTGSEAVLSFFAKVFDTGISKPVLAVIPSLSSESQQLADVYRISVASDESADGVLEKFKAIVQ